MIRQVLIRSLYIYCLAVFVFADTQGDFDLPSVLPCPPSFLGKLREFIPKNREAWALFLPIKQKALTLLDIQPHPLSVIYYEGLLHTDPQRLATVEKLREMVDLTILLQYWQGSGDQRVVPTLKKFVIAWTTTYKITGNDVNENKLWPLLVAYYHLRPECSEEERKKVDQWVESFGSVHFAKVKTEKRYTNRFTKRLRLLFISGIILERREWMEGTLQGIRTFVEKGLYPDGTSEDLRVRDTLTYHCSALVPVIEILRIGGGEYESLYTWESPSGSSIKKSVEYVVPYARGEKTREEWKNSQVELDRRRAEAGLEYYRPGSLFKPKSALNLIQLSAYFEPSLEDVVEKLWEEEDPLQVNWVAILNKLSKK